MWIAQSEITAAPTGTVIHYTMHSKSIRGFSVWHGSRGHYPIFQFFRQIADLKKNTLMYIICFFFQNYSRRKGVFFKSAI